MVNPNIEEYAFEEALRRNEALRDLVQQVREQRQREQLEASDARLPARTTRGDVVSPTSQAVSVALGTNIGGLVAACFARMATRAENVRWKKIPPETAEQMRRVTHEEVTGVIEVMQVQYKAVASALALQLELELADQIYEKLTHPDTNVLQQELLFAAFERHRREALGILANQQLPPPTVL